MLSPGRTECCFSVQVSSVVSGGDRGVFAGSTSDQIATELVDDTKRL